MPTKLSIFQRIQEQTKENNGYLMLYFMRYGFGHKRVDE
jgi:hypothetical protein